ncbi:hypothetical protein AB5I39_16525 [Sphingomonas sp. MMS24-J45]|uniref:hypothetical protein n=1 Tax=Sphingomonas sp. MMS24-J45 TaxID=3238806 RepID=UPI0038505C13
MFRAVLATLLVAVISPAEAPVQEAAATAKAGTLTDLTSNFEKVVDRTAKLSDAERVQAFHAAFDPIVPGYFDGKGARQPGFDAMILWHLKEWPGKRDKITATAAAFGAAFARGQDHFRAAFPDYALTVPVYLVHSMSQQDGGTRTIGGRTILFFGADVIAAIHDDTTIGPFLDHELFHVYHEQYFRGCMELWCSLWREGLATYAAARLNPGADDRALLLTQPQPIRPKVEPRLAEAMCGLRAKFNSVQRDDYGPLFLLGRSSGPFPSRYGYFLGYLLAGKLAATTPLQALAKLPPEKVKPLLEAAIDSYGPCPPPARATP